MKSKLIKCTPRMKDGAHMKWEDNFLFTLEFADGSKGGCMTKSQSGYEINKEYEFDVIQKGDYSNIKIKSDKPGFASKPPVQTHTQIAWLACLNASAVFCQGRHNISSKEMITLTQKLFETYKDDTSKN